MGPPIYHDEELIRLLCSVNCNPEKLPGNAGVFYRQQAEPERSRQLEEAKRQAAEQEQDRR